MSIPNLIAHCLGPSSSIGVWSTYKSLILDVDWDPISLKPEVGHVSPAWMLASFVLYRQPELLWVHWYRNSIISRDTIFIWCLHNCYYHLPSYSSTMVSKLWLNAYKSFSPLRVSTPQTLCNLTVCEIRH